MNNFDENYTGRKIRGFALSEGFLSQYADKPDPMTELGRFVFTRTYSRPKEDGTLESWYDVCVRVVEGVFTIQKLHVKKLHIPWDDRKAQRTAHIMFERMFEMKWLPPGRGLWAMGTAMIEEKGSAPLNNCGFTSTKNLSTDFSGPFCWLMDFSMLGVGCGGNTKGAGTITLKEPPAPDASLSFVSSWKIPDSREGWVETVRIVLEAYAKGRPIPRFDYSGIRPKGSPIHGFGGTASGPEPLKELVSTLVSILDKEVGKPISSTAIVDLFNAIGRAVVAGGIRRTAEIMFGDPADDAFVNLKNRDEVDKLWAEYSDTQSEEILERFNNHPVNKYRWASNNSMLGFVGMDYERYVESISTTGEPGFIWLDNMRKFGRLIDGLNWADMAAEGCNPCGEQTLEDREICNLVETFPAKHENLADYIKTLKVAYLYAKSVTLIPTHDPRTNAVMMRNRRIGCSMSGIVQAINKVGRADFRTWCESGYCKIQELDKSYSDWLCVPRSKKTTSVKPSGTVSILANATPGIHYPHSPFYVRNVRIASTSPLVKACLDAGYMVETDQVAPNTVVVSFPVKEDNFVKSKFDVSMWEQFSNASDLQTYWSDNQVSITITFKPEEVKDISTCLSIYETSLKSVSLLPFDCGSYKQAPYISISKEKYEEMTRDLKGLNFRSAVHEVTERFCDGDSCAIS